MQTEIKRWGNSAAVRIPGKLLAAAHLDIAAAVSLRPEDGKIIIERLDDVPISRLNLPFDETCLLRGLTAETAHADAIAQLLPGEIAE